jgi:hypothetical protein
MWSRSILTSSLVGKTMELSSNQFKLINWLWIILIWLIQNFYIYKRIQKINIMIRLVDLMNEESFDKKKLLKLIKKHDDAMITTSRGKEYVIYNPNNGNQDNTDMWDGNKSLFAVDSNGGEHEIRYKDITSFKA